MRWLSSVTLLLVCVKVPCEARWSTKGSSKKKKKQQQQQATKHSSGSPSEAVTVIVSTDGRDGFRVSCVESTLSLYSSSSLVARTIVVWNSRAGLPSRLEVFRRRRGVTFVTPHLERQRGPKKQQQQQQQQRVVAPLLARWLATADKVETELVLILDDTVAALPRAIECLVRAAGRHGLLGPFARTVDGDSLTHSNDPLLASPEYALILPRLALATRRHLIDYSKVPKELLLFVQAEPTHSDDLLLNLVADDRKRVVPPPASVIDYSRNCRRDHRRRPARPERALSLRHNRSTFWRTVALRTLALDPHFSTAAFPSYRTDAYTCDALESSGEPPATDSTPDGEAAAALVEGAARSLELLPRAIRHLETKSLVNSMYLDAPCLIDDPPPP